MVKKRKSVLRSSTQVIDSPMKEPRIISNYDNDIQTIKYLITTCLYFRR